MGNLGTPDNKKNPDFMSFRFSINPFGGHREILSAPEIPKAFGIRDCGFILFSCLS
jgi:hypothetical protein